MSRMEEPLEPDARRRKLDELFADDPYLSPTMKARLPANTTWIWRWVSFTPGAWTGAVIGRPRPTRPA